MALAERAPRVLKGKSKPRLAPPTPVLSDVPGFRAVAQNVGIDLMPWQEEAARYLTARDAENRWLYREVAIIVARQNGKTMLLVPLIVQRLRAGQRIMHTAQDRDLPREVFGIVADIFADDLTLFPQRNGRQTRPRFSNGQEEIKLANGGVYKIVAPTRGGARGPSRDLVIIDELREMDTWDFIQAAKPTQTASKNPQMLYLSNAGEEDSIVLNAIRARAETDPRLAYLEWSSSPERDVSDRKGWAEANPGMGYERGEMGSIIKTLEDDYETALLEGTMAHFETEHLCRKMPSMRQRLCTEGDWQNCGVDELPAPVRPYMGVSMDPSGKRASAALAWPIGADEFGLQLLLEGTGNPIEPDLLGPELRDMARKHGVLDVGFDPLTDQALARFFPRSKPLSGQAYANASARFVMAVESGKLRWTDCAAVGEDLTWTARKEHDESGSFQAVRANDERPITAALAAIRAVAMAAMKPRPVPGPRQPLAVGF